VESNVHQVGAKAGRFAGDFHLITPVTQRYTD